MTAVTPDRQLQVERWLYREARLLDERRWDLWLDLLTQDFRYLVPDRAWRMQSDIRDFSTWSVDAELAPAGGVAFIDEGLDALRQRIGRFQTGMGWSEMPASMTRRIVGNVMIDSDEGGELAVVSNLLLHKVRPEETVLFSAQRRDRLREGPKEGFLLGSRTVVLDAVVLPSENLSLLF